MVGHYQKCDFLELSVTTESFRYFVDYASCFLLNCSSTMSKHLSPSILLEAIAFDVKQKNHTKVQRLDLIIFTRRRLAGSNGSHGRSPP